jgi:CubicO group peptidase (beta-lactamase class C family)
VTPQSTSRRRFLTGVAGACAAGAVGPATAAVADGAEQHAPTAASTLESTVDDIVSESLEEHDVPGATVAVVADGEVAFAKGYGVADRESGAAVDPAQTRFRIGSVSKAVTFTALMRRVQRGDLEPTTPVADIVEDVALETTADAPITLADLATHRGGFEPVDGLWWDPGSDLPSLVEALNDQPRQARAPSTVASYSNYGAALAGQALAATRGEQFATAIEQELLAPAGMTASSFRQPPPSSVTEAHATGHAPNGQLFRDGVFPLLALRPAGSMSATARDMARFLQLHCNDGVVDGERVLKSETVDALHRQWATHHERLPGMAFGLSERRVGDHRVLEHNGSTLVFHSDMVLVPEQGLGLFVSFNGSGGASAREDVTEGFLDTALSSDDTSTQTSDSTEPSPDGDPTRAADLEGTYRSLRVARSSHTRLRDTLVQAPTVQVSVADDGALVTELGDDQSRWAEVEPLVFQRVDGSDRLAFGTDDDGAVEHLFLGALPTTAFRRVDTHERTALHAWLALLALLVMSSAVAGWPTTAAVRWLRSEATGVTDWRGWRDQPRVLARLTAFAASVAFLGFLVLAAIHFVVSGLAVFSNPPATFQVLFALQLLGAGGAVATALWTGRAWLDGLGTLPRRVHYSVVAHALLVWTIELWYWNLLVPPL